MQKHLLGCNILSHIEGYNHNPGGNLQFRQMKPMQKCFKPAFFLLSSRGQLDWLQKEVHLYESQYKNEPISHLIYELS